MKVFFFFFLCLLSAKSMTQSAIENDLLSTVKHGYAENQGVKIHYVTIGEGPLLVMLHGFPDYWYTWRDQINVLKEHFQVVAMDLRGYNLSDQPKGVESYRMKYLMEDVIAVIKAFDQKRAIIVGHDWGGAIAWQLAIHRPEFVRKLIVCNITHPTGSSMETLERLTANGNQSYTDDFRTYTGENLPITWLYGWVKDEKAKQQYIEAFKRSDVDAMIHYYRANLPDREERQRWLDDRRIPQLPAVKAPTLILFGLQDQYVLKNGLNGTWDWIENDLTIITIPEAGHFVQQDASEKVSRSMKMWLLQEDIKYQSRLSFSFRGSLFRLLFVAKSVIMLGITPDLTPRSA